MRERRAYSEYRNKERRNPRVLAVRVRDATLNPLRRAKRTLPAAVYVHNYTTTTAVVPRRIRFEHYPTALVHNENRYRSRYFLAALD